MNASNIRCLVSAGPTREFFDPVRFMSNPSSGKMGYAIAEAALDAGWVVDLVSGPVGLQPPRGVNIIPVVTGREMLEAVESRFPKCDILIMCAAVMDYRPRVYSTSKLKKTDTVLNVALEPVVDILKKVSAGKTSRQMVVGFAAETDHIVAYAQDKLERKNCNFIVANNVSLPDGGFESDSNAVLVIGPEGVLREMGPASKSVIAHDLVRFFKEQYRLHQIFTGSAERES